jgi:hypothetical protein
MKLQEHLYNKTKDNHIISEAFKITPDFKTILKILWKKYNPFFKDILKPSWNDDLLPPNREVWIDSIVRYNGKIR